MIAAAISIAVLALVLLKFHGSRSNTAERLVTGLKRVRISADMGYISLLMAAVDIGEMLIAILMFTIQICNGEYPDDVKLCAKSLERQTRIVLIVLLASLIAFTPNKLLTYTRTLTAKLSEISATFNVLLQEMKVEEWIVLEADRKLAYGGG